MAGKLNLFRLGQGGVNLVKDPLHLSDDEVTQAQNAEIQSDVNTGGEGGLTKRAGLAVLNSSALAGSILGMWGLPILTTYTRTLYAARGSATANTFATTTNGTTFALTSTPLAGTLQTQWSDENAARDAHRFATFKNLILYPGNNYTKGTDNPEIDVYDGTTGQIVSRINIGPSGNGGPAYSITDMLVANGKVYIGVHDPGGTGVNIAGRVLVYDPVTGKIQQVMNAMGPGTGEVTGGAPSALAYYQGQLYVGLNGSTTTDGIGKVVRGYPDIGTTWTTDVSNLSGHIASIFPFKGDLYVGTMSSVSSVAKVYKRTSTTAAYTTVYSSSFAGENSFMGNLITYVDELYATEYSGGGDTDAVIIHIKKSTDGASWTTDRDVDATDSGVAGNIPTNSLLFGSDLFISFRATTATGTNGFIDRKSAGTWSKVDTANYNGQMVQLVQRA